MITAPWPSAPIPAGDAAIAQEREQVSRSAGQQVSGGRYGNCSDHIRPDRESAAELRGPVDEGPNGGIGDRSIDAVFTEARRRAFAQIQALAAEAARG